MTVIVDANESLALLTLAIIIMTNGIRVITIIDSRGISIAVNLIREASYICWICHSQYHDYSRK
jgi:hypothetical protein